MKRQRISTLFERICVAEIPDSISDEAHERLEEALRRYAYETSDQCSEETSCHWTIQVHQENQETPPEYKSTSLEQSRCFWSSPLRPGKPDKREWRILTEKKRVIFNYRKHELTSSGSIADFISLCYPLLKRCQDALSLRIWPRLRLGYFFIYDDDSLIGTEYISDYSQSAPSGKTIQGQFIDLRKFLVPFNSFPQLDGFNTFIPPCKYQLKWKQEANAHEYLCSVTIDTDASEAEHLRISMPLDVILSDANGSRAEFEEMYGILQRNYTGFICKEAWKLLGDDCR